MDSTHLILQNPWWSNPDAISDDQKINAIIGRDFYYENPLLAKLSLSPKAFHIIRGPRQVGKSTSLKFIISRLIESRDVLAENILYLSCENLVDHKELDALLLPWLSQNMRPRRERFCVLLDEISFVADWQRAVLGFLNAGLFEKGCLIITGSNARDLKENSERFPGRRNGGKDINLFPLSPNEMQTLKCFEHLDRRSLVELYLKIGGFPHAIQSYVENGLVTDEVYEIYRNWIIGDAVQYGLSEESLKHILYRIAVCSPSRITWPKIIENTPIKSHETALNYIEHLEESFLCKIHYCLDPNKQMPALSKARKLFFIDPSIYDMAKAWRQNETNIWSSAEQRSTQPDAMGNILESAYVTCASRSRSTYFWYSTKVKKEVDLLWYEASELKAYDCKWKPDGHYAALNQQIETIGPDDWFSFSAW